jgi:hypothetical protein
MAKPTPPAQLPEQSPHELCQRVLERALVAERVGDAVESRDVARAAALAEAIERAAAGMSRAAAAFKAAPPPPGQAALINQQLGTLLARVKAADVRNRALFGAAGVDSLTAWLQRCGQSAFVDEVLHAPWDRTRDLVVVGAPPDDPLVIALKAAGQRRIFCLHGPTRAIETSAAHTLRAFATLAELEVACAEIAWPPPTRARIVGNFGAETVGITTRVQEATSRVAQMVESFGLYGRAFLTAGARNLGAIARYPSVAALKGLFKGVPALIVSAGPSLDLNLDQVARWKGRAVIIAINRSVQALRRAGVAPDIALAIDPLNLSSHFAGLRPGELTALGLGAAVAPELFEVPAERVFTIAASPDIESWMYEPLKEDARLPFGGTVAHTALQLALRMGCAPITVIGQDFALDGAKFYADGAADGGRRAEARAGSHGPTLDLARVTDRVALSAGMSELERALPRLGEVDLVRVPGYHGDEVLTTPTMQSQLCAFRQMAVAAAARTRLVNATEGGAFIEGMEHLPLAAMTATLGKIERDIARKLRAALEPRQVQRRCGRMAKALSSLSEKLTALEAAAEVPFLRTWALGTRRGLRDAGEPDDEALALLLAAGEALAVYGPAIERALAQLSGVEPTSDVSASLRAFAVEVLHLDVGVPGARHAGRRHRLLHRLHLRG